MPVDLSDAILAFWFGEVPHVSRKEWFRKDTVFDDAIRTRFGDAVAEATAGGYGAWCHEAHGALARVLLLDQFTRNIHRGSAVAFSGDARALSTAQFAVEKHYDRELDPYERWFLYLPFEHSENRVVQEQSLHLFAALARDTGLTSPLNYAQRHHDIVARFGRFPHRNALLGRASTPEELDFLQMPGTAF
jgi:uncharacterized protein (DUF924 family)